MAVILGSSPIKSIQRGQMTMSIQGSSGIGQDSTATINSVDVTKSFISASCNSAAGFSTSSGASGASLGTGTPTAGVKLTSATTLLATLGNVPFAGTAPQSLSTGVLYFEVIEYV